MAQIYNFNRLKRKTFSLSALLHLVEHLTILKIDVKSRRIFGGAIEQMAALRRQFTWFYKFEGTNCSYLRRYALLKTLIY
jgi:hypothetical protein